MKNVNIQKINKMGKAIRILTKISMVFAIIGAVFCITGSIILGSIDTGNFRTEGNIDAKVYVTGIENTDNPITENGGSISINDNVEITKEKIDIEEFLTLWFETEETDNNEVCFNISSNLSDDFSVWALRNNWIGEIVVTALMLVSMAIGMGYASRLAKSIETCETPFCEEVVKRMKAFAYSMIPYAVFGGIDGGIQIAICVIAIILMIFIFSYGCSLQTENDDMV